MGSWFSNVHIRKNETASEEKVIEFIRGWMASKQYVPCAAETDADGAVAMIAEEDCQWISVYSDLLSFENPGKYTEIATPLSAELHTDVLGISCFDSDYLYLNLVNADEEVNGWVGIGKGAELGIKRRNSLTPWKKKVADYPAFSAAAKESYICADEFLSVAAPHLGLPVDQSATSLDYLKDEELNAQASYLYFRAEYEKLDARVPKLASCYLRYALPCLNGKENKMAALNVGTASKGLTICFMGPFVEHEEISFEDVTIKDLAGKQCYYPLLKKIQLSDGQWAYVGHIADYEILPAIPKRITDARRRRLEDERIIWIYFTPYGNPRKMLDVTVSIFPDENPQGQAIWNVWHRHGSKSAFIKYHNKTWKMLRNFESEENCLPLFKESDFDD
jgi:hypothetical protein